MAKKKTFTLKSLLDEHVKKLVAGNTLSKVAYDGFVSTFADALDTPIAIPDSIPVPDLAAAADAAGAALAPIDPAKALQDIAKAVAEAEKMFNGQNLAVLHGKVNVQLLVKVGDIAGAQANFDLAIGPIPQG